MKNKLIYIFMFLMFSCDFNNDPIPVSNLNQDNLSYKKFNLNSFLSDTVNTINEFGVSSLIYAGSINDSDYVYSIFEFDKEIFENYDLCTKDSLSFKELYLVFDVVNEYLPYSIDNINENTNNLNDNISLDIPPFFAYLLNYEDLKDSQGNIILNDNWSEQDLIVFNDLDLEDYFYAYNSDNTKRLFVEHHLGKYYINLTEKMIGSSDDCQAISDESSCIDSCIWDKGSCQALEEIELCNLNIISTYIISIFSNILKSKLWFFSHKNIY